MNNTATEYDDVDKCPDSKYNADIVCFTDTRIGAIGAIKESADTTFDPINVTVPTITPVKIPRQTFLEYIVVCDIVRRTIDRTETDNE
jgi:hypothetical protein